MDISFWGPPLTPPQAAVTLRDSVFSQSTQNHRGGAHSAPSTIVLPSWELHARGLVGPRPAWSDAGGLLTPTLAPTAGSFHLPPKLNALHDKNIVFFFSHLGIRTRKVSSWLCHIWVLVIHESTASFWFPFQVMFTRSFSGCPSKRPL